VCLPNIPPLFLIGGNTGPDNDFTPEEIFLIPADLNQPDHAQGEIKRLKKTGKKD